MKFNHVVQWVIVFLAGSCFGMNMILSAIPETRDKDVRFIWAAIAVVTGILAPIGWRDQP